MKNKKKLIIIISSIIVVLTCWIRAYSSFSKSSTSIVDNNKQKISDEELCKQQYWINATVWEPWYCACKEWYQRSNDKTKCIIIIKNDRIEEPTISKETRKEQKKEQERNTNNTFRWLEDTKNNDIKLIPLDEWEKWQKFVEKSYAAEPDPDRKLKEWEELIVDEHSRIKAIHNEDEDYLWNIIDWINTKKRFRENPQNGKPNNIKQNNWTTNAQNTSQTLIENFIGTIETKQTNEWIIYEYTFTDPNFWITPVRIWFISNTKITNSDITTDIGWNWININKLKFHWGISNVEVTKDFWVLRCWPFEPEWYIFNPWKNKFSLKGQWEDWFDYINYFRGRIYPVFSFPWTELTEWNKNCIIEIWRKENFTKFPFELKWSFENAVVAITKNKNLNSNCMQLLGNHDNIMVIYNEEIACEIWYNNWTSLREISTK